MVIIKMCRGETRDVVCYPCLLHHNSLENAYDPRLLYHKTRKIDYPQPVGQVSSLYRPNPEGEVVAHEARMINTHHWR